MTTIVTDGAAQPGPTGATGATGATGNGAVFTSVDSLHASPRSVTDWGSIINTAIAGGSMHFVFGPYDYPFTTMVVGDGIPGLIFEGTSGWNWGVFASQNRTRLIWGGTGATNMFSFVAASPGNASVPTGFVFKDLQLVYSSGSYTGTLVLTENSGFAVVERVVCAPTDGAFTSAYAAFDLQSMNTIDFLHCTFGGFTTAARGRHSGSGGGYSNVVRFHECTFDCRAITNPGLDYVYDHCIFEFPGLPANDAFFTTDFTYTGDSIDVTLRNCEYWDASANGQKVVYAPAGNDWTFSAYDCTDHNSTGVLAQLYDFQGTGAIRIIGGSTLQTIDFGDGSSSTHRKILINVIGMSTYLNVLNQEQFINVDSGHSNVLLLGNEHGANYQGVLRDGRVRAESLSTPWQVSGHQPTIAAHSGITNLTTAIFGSDFAGIILLSNTAGAPSATGLLADVTINLPPANKGPTNDFVFPLVQLTPYEASSNVTSGNCGAQSALCLPYVHAVGGTLGSFSIGVQVAIPASGNVQYAYSVVNLNGNE